MRRRCRHKIRDLTYSPYWEAELFKTSQIDDFAEALDPHKPVCARIPVYLIPRGSQPEASYFDVVLKRDPALEGPLDESIHTHPRKEYCPKGKT